MYLNTVNNTFIICWNTQVATMISNSWGYKLLTQDLQYSEKKPIINSIFCVGIRVEYTFSKINSVFFSNKGIR